VVAGPDGRIYSIGYLAAGVRAYDPEHDRWEYVVSNMFSRDQGGAALGPDGRIYLIGGSGSNGADTVEAYGPVVTLSASHGSPGALLLVQGSNFAASATVSVHFGGKDDALLATGSTTKNGGLAPWIVWTVPDSPPGDYLLTVVDDKSRFPITLPFTIDPAP
jgi:hypothetical protein